MLFQNSTPTRWRWPYRMTTVSYTNTKSNSKNNNPVFAFQHSSQDCGSSKSSPWWLPLRVLLDSSVKPTKVCAEISPLTWSVSWTGLIRRRSLWSHFILQRLRPMFPVCLKGWRPPVATTRPSLTKERLHPSGTFACKFVLTVLLKVSSRSGTDWRFDSIRGPFSSSTPSFEHCFEKVRILFHKTECLKTGASFETFLERKVIS